MEPTDTTEASERTAYRALGFRWGRTVTNERQETLRSIHNCRSRSRAEALRECGEARVAKDLVTEYQGKEWGTQQQIFGDRAALDAHHSTSAEGTQQGLGK